ncbi:hypothetical protein BSPLISOX_360 [uncultured Gammaproteobacteria bacterium]|nr:hypothetical protein BSPLISOX_360 [uncultured Gammaproteobacteria bacterium]
MHPLVAAIPRFIQLGVPLPPLKTMGQSRRGVIQVLEVQVHPLVAAIPRFIQLGVPLPPLKLMEQSRRGVIRIVEDLPLHPIKYRLVST